MNGSGENGTITCLGKYHNRDGENLTINNTFTFNGNYIKQTELLGTALIVHVQLLIMMMSTGPTGQQCQSVPDLVERTVDREPRPRGENALESEEGNFAS